MSTPERQQDADPDKGSGYGSSDQPDKKRAEELENGHQSEEDAKRPSQEKPDAARSREPHDATAARAESAR